jgi:putative ABC transport system permease protein
VNLGAALKMSLRAIRAHRLRSGLTLLGVVIGVAAVITFVTLGASLQSDIVGELDSGDVSRLYVWMGPEEPNGPPGFGAEAVFTESDLEAMGALDGVAAVYPVEAVQTSAIGFDGQTVARGDVLFATDPALLSGAEFRDGQAFEVGTRQAVLNAAAAASFDRNVSVGDTLTVTYATGESVAVDVVGVLDGSAALSPFEGAGFDPEAPRIYVATDPFYGMRVTAPASGETERVYTYLVVQAASIPDVEVARESVTTFATGDSDAAELRPEGHAPTVQTGDDLLDQLRDIIDTLTGFVTGIAVISLLVGAIGIANIMLVSVTERTREIGIMKAVGATNRDVLGLFLTEAVVLGVVGAVLGTAVGFACGTLAASWLDLSTVYPLEWVGIAALVGVLVGVGSGLYPAWNAARTDPIEALRYE